jgi:hypothetical protein
MLNIDRAFITSHNNKIKLYYSLFYVAKNGGCRIGHDDAITSNKTTKKGGSLVTIA